PAISHPPSPTLFPYTTLFRSAHLRPHRTPGQLEAVAVPRLLRFGRGLDPVFRRAHEVGGRHDIVDELHRLGAIEPDLIAFQQERSEEHTSELQSLAYFVCRLL